MSMQGAAPSPPRHIKNGSPGAATPMKYAPFVGRHDPARRKAPFAKGAVERSETEGFPFPRRGKSSVICFANATSFCERRLKRKGKHIL